LVTQHTTTQPGRPAGGDHCLTSHSEWV